MIDFGTGELIERGIYFKGIFLKCLKHIFKICLFYSLCFNKIFIKIAVRDIKVNDIFIMSFFLLSWVYSNKDSIMKIIYKKYITYVFLYWFLHFCSSV